MQMTSHLKEPRDTNPITKAQIRPDRLFTASSTNKHAAYTHSAEVLLLQKSMSSLRPSITIRLKLFEKENSVTETPHDVVSNLHDFLSLNIKGELKEKEYHGCFFFHHIPSHMID